MKRQAERMGRTTEKTKCPPLRDTAWKDPLVGTALKNITKMRIDRFRNS